MKESVLQRIKDVMKAKARSKNDFAIKLSMGQTTVNNYVNGDRAISLDFILHILATFTDISAEWLLRGEGSMYRQPVSAEITINGPQTVSGSNNITNSPNAVSQSQDMTTFLMEQNKLLQEQNVNLNALLSSLIKNK